MTETPDWFTAAISHEPQSHRISVDGAEINYLTWGEPGLPGIVFVHVGAAHAHWWSHIAPAFSDAHRVAAIDLSGHGDSSWRNTYTLNGWRDEVAAVIGNAGFSGPRHMPTPPRLGPGSALFPSRPSICRM